MKARAILRGIFLTVALCALALAFTTCGGRKSAINPPSIGSGGLQAADSLDGALAELDALETPEGVDAALFEELKDALEEALITQLESRFSNRDPKGRSGGLQATTPLIARPGDRASNIVPTTARFASTPPTGNTNRIDDLACSLNDEDEFVLSWLYRNCGDYDQSGAVGISDITPIAMHFGEAAGPENEWIDGDSDGRVHISDITPIAMYFGANVHHYSIQGSHFFSSSFTETAQLVFPESTPNDARLVLERSLGEEPEYLYWRIVPVDGEGNPGDASNTAQVSAAPPPPVRILSVNPLGGATGTEVTFSAVISGVAPFDYEWNFGEGATPNESTETSPTVTLGAVDVYDASLSVENADGSAVKHFTLTVTVEPGEPPEIVSVSPTEGDSGTEATFTAEVTGDGTFEYYWDFGGGASPNQSSGVSGQPSATVILSRGGTLPEPVRTYPARLIVVNPFGMTTHDFTLSVSAWWHIVIDEWPENCVGYKTFGFEPDGTPAIVIMRKPIDEFGAPYEMYYCRWTDNKWEEELVDPSITGIKPALAFDPQGRPGILFAGGFLCEGNKYLHFDGTQWTRDDFDDGAIVVSMNLAYLPSGAPYAVYSLSGIIGKDMKAATKRGSEWIVETVVSSSEERVGDCSMVLDASGIPHIAFEYSTLETYGIHYATKQDGVWVFEDIVQNTGGIGTIRVDYQNAVSVLYGGSEGTYFARRIGDHWVSDRIDEIGLNYGQHVVEMNGFPVIARFLYWEERVIVTFQRDKAWHTSQVSPEAVRTHGAGQIIIDPDGNLAIRYGETAAEGRRALLVLYW